MLLLPKKQENKKIQRYKELRESGRPLASKIMDAMPKRFIDNMAKEMNILVKGVLVFDSEDEMGFLFDRLIFDFIWDGKNAVEHFEAENKSELSEDERKHLNAMKEARFSLFEVVGRNFGMSVYLSDLLSGILLSSRTELTDINMSKTFSVGSLLATRIVRIEDICMATGASYPFLPIHKDTLISGIKKIQTTKNGKVNDFDISRDYGLYFYRQHRKFGLEMATSEEYE
ncbi:MAG: hypothetical protein AAB116_25025 [Candidatus Poribacteria bacterium]